ncbi:MAG: hypothetical protein PHV37_04490 [Candidatus Gastranaerophilales bacterium]|nr:hypothetical protein [Candidatus Gastranaerophilales bacterium]
MLKFSLKFQNRIINLEQALDFVGFVIKFIENHFNCNLERYRITIDVLNKLCLAIKGINDHKPEKYKCKIAIDVLSEIAELQIKNEKELKKIRESAAFCKIVLDRCNN